MKQIAIVAALLLFITPAQAGFVPGFVFGYAIGSIGAQPGMNGAPTPSNVVYSAPKEIWEIVKQDEMKMSVIGIKHWRDGPMTLRKIREQLKATRLLYVTRYACADGGECSQFFVVYE